jgi:hypothetical protein
VLFYVDQANAVEFEKLGTSVAKTLGTPKAFKAEAKVDGKAADVFYSKGSDGRANKLAVIQKGIYEPNCTHTWVIGVNPATAKVEQIRVVEMSCPHAFPTNKASFLDQFKGKGPADAKTLKENTHVIAKATGSSNLTADAVSIAIQAAVQLKGKI